MQLQLADVDEPEAEVKPAAQAAHEGAPTNTEYVPTSQFVHVVAPAAEYCPAGQLVQDVLPYMPAVQEDEGGE